MNKFFIILFWLITIVWLSWCSSPEEKQKEIEQEIAKQAVDEVFWEWAAEKIIESAKKDEEIILESAKDAIPFEEWVVLFEVEFDNETDTETFKMPEWNVKVTAEMSWREGTDSCSFNLRREGVDSFSYFQIYANTSLASMVTLRWGEYYLEVMNSYENKCKLTIETVWPDYMPIIAPIIEWSLFTVSYDTSTDSKIFDLPEWRIEAKIEMTSNAEFAYCNFDLYSESGFHNHMFNKWESESTTFRVKSWKNRLELSSSSNNICTLSFYEVE